MPVRLETAGREQAAVVAAAGAVHTVVAGKTGSRMILTQARGIASRHPLVVGIVAVGVEAAAARPGEGNWVVRPDVCALDRRSHQVETYLETRESRNHHCHHNLACGPVWRNCRSCAQTRMGLYVMTMLVVAGRFLLV